MALKPPTSGLKSPVPGLRRLRNDSKQPAKVSVIVAPGDELEVSDDLASQLQAASGAIKPAEGLAPFPDLSSEPEAPADSAGIEPADAPTATPAKRARASKKSAG